MAEGERVVRGALPATRLAMDFVKSAFGAKVFMAATGLALWAFVIVHLLGNLQIFQGAEVINAYGPFLRGLGHGTFIWVARGGLILAFAVHIFFALRLAALNRAARPVGYVKKKRMRTTGAAMTMTFSGLLFLAFLFFHLSHTTWGFIVPQYFNDVTLKDGTVARDVFQMMWHGFKIPWLVLVYVIGQIVLLAHLFHGTASLWQSIGWHHPTWSPVVSMLGRAIAAIIFVLNVSMPLYIFFFWGTPT